MQRLDSESGPSRFRTTAWSIVATAQDPESNNYHQSIEYLCKSYWKPIYYFIRRRGINHNHAKDLTQDYFATFLEKRFVDAADQNRGRFRTFILTTLTRFMAKQYKRDKYRKLTVPLVISSSESDLEFERNELATDNTPEDEFNRSWARSLIEQTLLQMNEFCTENKKKQYFQIFSQYLESACDTKTNSYREIAQKFQLSESDVTNYLHRGRNIFQKLLRAKVRQSVISESDVDLEIVALRKYFA